MHIPIRTLVSHLSLSSLSGNCARHFIDRNVIHSHSCNSHGMTAEFLIVKISRTNHYKGLSDVVEIYKYANKYRSFLTLLIVFD